MSNILVEVTLVCILSRVVQSTPRRCSNPIPSHYEYFREFTGDNYLISASVEFCMPVQIEVVGRIVRTTLPDERIAFVSTKEGSFECVEPENCRGETQVVHKLNNNGILIKHCRSGEEEIYLLVRDYNDEIPNFLPDGLTPDVVRKLCDPSLRPADNSI